MPKTTSDRERNAELNDLARTAMGVSSRLYVTQGIAALPAQDQSRIREKVELFDDFSDDNDPYGERDFGSFQYETHKVFWKIDCYNRTLDGGSPDPTDPAVSIRVLTIMLAHEY